MDISFELLTSMSPKVTTRHKSTDKNPTVLALKKYFRKSLLLSKTVHNPNNESIITISSSGSSEDSEIVNRTPIVISDSEKSFNMKEKSKKTPQDHSTSEKYSKIENWIINVNKACENESLFSEVSRISTCESYTTKDDHLDIAVNSTFINTKTRHFHELFKTGEKKKSSLGNEIEDSLQSASNHDSDNVIEESFELELNTSLTSRIKRKDNNDENDLKQLLDSLYGASWREKQNEILPVSEPRITTKKEPIKRFPKTERRQTNKNVAGNWFNRLKNVCDSDTESDNSENYRKLPHGKLNFDDDISDDDDEIPKTPQKKTFSFLASLSKNIPESKSDPSALIFRDHFQQYKNELGQRLFKLYNEQVFGNSLPKDTVIEWNGRMTGTAGRCTCKKITKRTGLTERTAKVALASKVIDSADRLRDTLIHELCHAATWIVNEVSDGHGAYWKTWAYRAMKAFPELPPINRCHNYVINTKYTYKCTRCGYSVGRHTKSLDTEKKRCGHCLGKFEILINKTSKTGETKTVPATPKKPNGFALFVKENYATLKTPDRKHGDVMKLLSKKFTDMKVENK